MLTWLAIQVKVVNGNVGKAFYWILVLSFYRSVRSGVRPWQWMTSLHCHYVTHR